MMRPVSLLVNLMQYLAVAALLAMMFLVTGDVVMRTAFGRPVFGIMDVVEFLLAGLVFLALPAVFLLGQHIVVDVLDNILPRRAVAALSATAGLIGAAMVGLLCWAASVPFHSMRAYGDTSLNLEWPLWIGGLPILAGLLVSTVAALLHLLRPHDPPVPAFKGDMQ